MLKYVINKNDMLKKERDLSFESITQDGDVLYISSPDHRLSEGSTVRITRYTADTVVFEEDFFVKVIDKDTFAIDFPEKMLFFSNEAKIEEKISGYTEINNTTYPLSSNILTIWVSGGTHCFVEDRDYLPVDVSMIVDDEGNVSASLSRKCNGDIVDVNIDFLWSAATNGDKYDFQNSALLNIKEKSIFLYNENTRDLLSGQGISPDADTGSTEWRYYASGSVIELKNCIIPCSLDGTDNLTAIFWPCQTSDGRIVAKYIISNIAPCTFECYDERFFRKENDAIVPFVGTKLKEVVTHAKISCGISESFMTDLNKEDYINNKFLDDEINLHKNPIVDYEKQTFFPVYTQNGECKDIKEITYKLHFRERVGDEWRTNDELLWTNETNKSDLLGTMGFTDDDVYYRKKRISKSFLRIMFYDSNDRRNQNLLFYSTIFMDGAELYSKYVKDKQDFFETPDSRGYVWTEYNDNSKRLCADIKCTNKYDTPSSSEGFYLYLFPSILEYQDKVDGETDDWRKIYVRFEFNHAKYGYTIPLVIKKDGPIRHNYLVNEGGLNRIDSAALFSDLYSEVHIRYDDIENRYIWRFPESENKVVSMDLYEPKINPGVND